MKFFYSLFIISFLSFQLFAQTENIPQTRVLGGNPSTIKWKYVNNGAVKVIFPEGNEKEGIRVANTIKFISDSVGITVGEKRKHLNLLIQTNQVISNGYVGLAPYRSEFYATGFQNFYLLGSLSWLDALSYHEYRHALQMANSKRGLTKFGYWIGGESMWQLLQAISIPNWYLEGDAVQTETVLSLAGRGRTPTFFQDQKALLFNDRHYKYIKARNGSFKDFVPNHYPLGYAMLHYGRNEFGEDTWRKTLARGSSFRSIFYPFSRALKHNTGLTTRKMYVKAYDKLETDWKKELETIELIPTTHVSPVSKRTVTNYTWAHQMEDGSIIALKGSYKRITHLIRIKDGKEENLQVIGNVTDYYLSVNNNIAAWCEMSKDARRNNRNYNNIIAYDLKTGKRRKVTAKTKLFSPEFSSKGDKIVAVKADQHIKNSIVFINAETGAETESIPNPENDFFSYPHWTKDDNAVVFLAKHVSEIAMMKYDLTTKVVTQLTPWSHHNLSAFNVGKENVYFSADYSGINNIYAVSLAGDQVLKQLSSVKIGANMPAVSADEKTLTMSEFNVMGQELTKQDINLTSAKTIALVEPVDMPTFSVKTTSVEKNIATRIPQNEYEVKDYKGFIRGPQLHTWGITSDLSSVGVGVRVDNILNDFGLNLSGGYNRNEGVYNGAATIDYARWYLPISLNAGIGDRAIKTYSNPVPTDGDTTVTLKFRESVVGGSLALPLSWMSGAYNTSLQLVGGVNYISTFDFSRENAASVDTTFNYTVFQGGLVFSNIRNRAYQNVLPRFGQVLAATVNQSVDNSSIAKIAVSGTAYFPGFLANHSLSFTGGWRQEKLSNGYRFLDNFNHARGYTPILSDEEYVLSGNYQLPLVYPDWGFGGIAYFKRIRLNLFGDVSQVTRYELSKSYSQNSVGFELLFDTTILNLLPMSIGLRESFLLDKDYFDNSKTSMFNFYLAGTF